MRLFSEKGCESAVSTAILTDDTPKFDPRFKLLCDERYGSYLDGENVSGDIYFLIGHKNSI